MLIPTIRRSVPCNLRRIAACVTYRNKMRAKIVRQCNGPNLLSTSVPIVGACRIYSTESDSKRRISLPMLVPDAESFSPSFFTPFRLFFLSYQTIPYIDKDFSLSETLDGMKYAIRVISKALANEDYDSLEGLVGEDMLEVLKTKIKTLSPEERWLIAVNEEDVIFQVLCDIAAKTDGEHDIQIKMLCHYITDLAEKKKMLEKSSFMDISKLGDMLVCNYTFTRKYVNNVGGPWVATFVNHYSVGNFMS